MSSKRGRPLKYRWDRIKLKGKAQFFKGNPAKLSPNAYAFAHRHNRVFTVHKVPNGISVRRIK